MCDNHLLRTNNSILKYFVINYALQQIRLNNNYIMHLRYTTNNANSNIRDLRPFKHQSLVAVLYHLTLISSNSDPKVWDLEQD